MSDPHHDSHRGENPVVFGSSAAHGGSPALEEPRTPKWLPALGAALFLLVGLLWAISGGPLEAKGPTAAVSAPHGAADAGAAARAH